jgi:hypothetical protein
MNILETNKSQQLGKLLRTGSIIQTNLSPRAEFEKCVKKSKPRKMQSLSNINRISLIYAKRFENWWKHFVKAKKLRNESEGDLNENVDLLEEMLGSRNASSERKNGMLDVAGDGAKIAVMAQMATLDPSLPLA